MFGVPAYAATVFMTMCVSALALTSLDAVARIGRMSFQELFSVDDMEHAPAWRKLCCNLYFSTFVTLAFGFVLTKIGYANIWPLFGSANQLLSALVLSTLCVFLKVTGRSNKMLMPPLVIMLCVTFTALVQRLLAMVSAIRTAASVTIPPRRRDHLDRCILCQRFAALILAVMLIVLGLNIVLHSVSAYKKAQDKTGAAKTSEQTATAHSRADPFSSFLTIQLSARPKGRRLFDALLMPYRKVEHPQSCRRSLFIIRSKWCCRHPSADGVQALGRHLQGLIHRVIHQLLALHADDAVELALLQQADSPITHSGSVDASAE